MNCPKCGAEIETTVVNVQDGSEGCWPCVAGPDQMMLRRVELETEHGIEVYLVYAKNNLDAFKIVVRPDVVRMIARPLVN